MSDRAANFPPTTPINRPSQIQKSFFPFSAFSADDPNVTASPVLTLASPWQLSGTFKGTGTALTTAITGTASSLASSNPTLLAGQIGYETDTKYFKVGDGSTAYNSLPYLYPGDTAWKVVGAASQPSFQNSWVNAGGVFATAAFRKDGMGFVHLRGTVALGTGGLAIFTLPAGYRPLAKLQWSGQGNGTTGYLAVDSSGNVIATAGSASGIGLDPIVFLGEQ